VIEEAGLRPARLKLGFRSGQVGVGALLDAGNDRALLTEDWN
jgi:hypothetical protein